MYIYLLVENGNKDTERKCKVCSNFGSLTRKHPHLPDGNQNTISNSIKPYNELGSQSLAERIIGIGAKNPLILSVTCYPTISRSPKVY